MTILLHLSALRAGALFHAHHLELEVSATGGRDEDR